MYPFLGIDPLSLRPLGPVLGAALLAVGNTHGIQRAANYVITNSGQIFHTATADEHDRVLLQVVADAGNVGRDFDTVGQPHTRDLAQRGIRLLRRLGVDAGTDTALLRTGLQRRTGRLVLRRCPALAHQLVECRHSLLLLRSSGQLSTGTVSAVSSRHLTASLPRLRLRCAKFVPLGAGQAKATHTSPLGAKRGTLVSDQVRRTTVAPWSFRSRPV